MVGELYIEVNLMCVALLVVMMYRVKHGVVREMEQFVFSNMGFHCLLLFFLDILWNLCDGMVFPYGNTCNRLINAAYFCQSGVLGYYWLRYAYFMDPSSKMGHGIKLYAAMIPMFLVVFFSVASIWTDWMFVIDDKNCYHRGAFLWIQVASTFSYMIFVFVRAISKSFMKRYFAYRDKLLAIAALGLVPLVGQLLQVALDGSSIFCVATTLAFAIVFFENQNQMVSLDPLTKMNNKGQLNRFLNSKINVELQGHLVLFVMDMDLLKHVNDTYGHVEGDKAILTVADVLKKNFGPRGIFISRFGGDEFVAVAELKEIGEADALCSLLEEKLEEASADFVYPLTVSVGFAERKGVTDNIPDMFARADKELYKAKALKKLKR